MSAVAHTAAPAINLVGVRCLICSTPLIDAKSAELGIGPTCRKKWGALDEIPGGEAARHIANRLIYDATVAKRDGQIGRVLEISGELRGMGLVKLADRINDRFIDIRMVDVVHEGEPWTDIYAPYRDGFAATLRAAIPPALLARVNITGRDVDGDPILSRARPPQGVFSHWSVHTRVKRLALAVVVRYYAGTGTVAAGSKGVFVLPSAREFQQKYVDQTLASGLITQPQHDDLVAALTR